MVIQWNNEKNELLKQSRNVSFEQVKEEIKKGAFVGSMSDVVFENLNLDKEEQWIEDHLDEFGTYDGAEEIRKQMIEAAKKDPKILYSDKENKKPVSLRLDATDIDKLKVIALDQGLNYQSLIGSVLHRYVAGTLIDIVEARKLFARKLQK